MVKTHEINLNTTEFNRFANSNYIVLEINNIEVNDYILFKQIELVDGSTTETGLFKMTKVKELIQNDGFKEGYALLIVNNI